MDYFGTNWVGGSPGATFANPSSIDDAHQVVAWYAFPFGTRLAAIAERLTYRTDDTVPEAVKGYQRDAVYGAVQQHVGDHALWGSFGVAHRGRCVRVGNLPCSTNGLNGLEWSVGYTYSPAKTVDIFASYYEMRTGRSAQYGLFPPVVPLAPGSDTHGFGLGIMYLFDISVGFGSREPPEAAPAAASERPTAAPPEEPRAAPPAEPPAASPEEPAPAPGDEPAPPAP
jgi:hypothetical protein